MTTFMHDGNKYTIQDLLYLMERLRDPVTGCPWDLKQTFATIVPHTIEETYEVADTIEREDWNHLREELGDLLFQVIFYSQLGSEEDLFNWDEVVSGVVAKLLRRHPHVFPDGTLQSVADPKNRPETAEINANWEKIKQQEKSRKRPDDSILSGIPTTLPPLIRAIKLQKQAAKQGFDWPEAGGIVSKMREELGELEEALAEGSDNRKRIEEELADIFFTSVNLGRFLGIDPDSALRGANRKFTARIQRIEKMIANRGASFSDLDPQELDALWEKAKQDG